MIVLDTTIVNVALPSIRADLGFSEASLAWVVNSYMLTFGGFLLLAGRLGDLFGHRRLFLIDLTVFTAASLACGVAGSAEFLVGGPGCRERARCGRLRRGMRYGDVGCEASPRGWGPAVGRSAAAVAMSGHCRRVSRRDPDRRMYLR